MNLSNGKATEKNDDLFYMNSPSNKQNERMKIISFSNVFVPRKNAKINDSHKVLSFINLKELFKAIIMSCEPEYHMIAMKLFRVHVILKQIKIGHKMLK